MSQFVASPTKSDTAAGAIGQHLRVKTTGALEVAGASDTALGTMELPCTAAGPATVRLANAQGTRRMVALAAFDKGVTLYAAAGGKVDDSGTVIEGYSLEAATADGDVVEVMPLGRNVLDAGTVTETGTQTLTNKTLTAPTLTAVTITGTSTIGNGMTLTTPVIGAATGTSLVATGVIASTGTAGVGYATGAGSAVTQETTIATTVVLNTICGTITTVSSTLAAGVDASFTLTNSRIAATDVVVINTKSYGGTADGIPVCKIQSVAAGSCVINVHNQGAVTLDAVIVMSFAVIKAVAA